MNKQKVKFKDKLIQAYKDGATSGLIFEDEREKYIKIRNANLHKMNPIPVCKIPK